MKKRDPALVITNPRILAAVYFGLLSVVGTILINAFLTSIGVEEVIPVYKSVLLGMLVSSAMGALFGEQIVHCKQPYLAKTFWLGFIMVIASLPVFDLGVVALMSKENVYLFAPVAWHEVVYFYFLVLGYSYILFGFLLAIGSGLAAMYLRGRLVYDILHTDETFPRTEEKPKRLRKTKIHKAHPVHH